MAITQFWGTGRRKTAVARVRLVPGKGDITINKRTMDDYFGLETLKMMASPVRPAPSVTASPELCLRPSPICVPL